jgi:hypothetical protein
MIYFLAHTLLSNKTLSCLSLNFSIVCVCTYLLYEEVIMCIYEIALSIHLLTRFIPLKANFAFYTSIPIFETKKAHK